MRKVGREGGRKREWDGIGITLRGLKDSLLTTKFKVTSVSVTPTSKSDANWHINLLLQQLIIHHSLIACALPLVKKSEPV